MQFILAFHIFVMFTIDLNHASYFYIAFKLALHFFNDDDSFFGCTAFLVH